MNLQNIFKNAEPELLDELVDEAMSRLATKINNGDIKTKLDVIFSAVGLNGALEVLLGCDEGGIEALNCSDAKVVQCSVLAYPPGATIYAKYGKLKVVNDPLFDCADLCLSDHRKMFVTVEAVELDSLWSDRYSGRKFSIGRDEIRFVLSSNEE